MWRFGVVVRRYIDILIIIINFPYSTCIRSFFGSSILTFCSFLNVFSVLFPLFFYNIIIANVTHRIFKIVQKIELSAVKASHDSYQTLQSMEQPNGARALRY